ncbi:MAG TPA: ABC transporter substrate-binding protein [Candidatus Binatia bacterium]
MKAIRFFIAMLIVLACAGQAAAAQQPAKSDKVWKIGVLVSSSPALNASRDEALKHGLRELGYEEGKNVHFEYRYAEGKVERLPDLAAELVHAKVDIIVAGGTRVAAAAKQATGTIPIVITGAGGLAEAGLVRSFSNPGGNVTGVSRISSDFFGKRLELLRAVVPKAQRIAALGNSATPGYDARLKDFDLSVRAAGMTFQPVSAKSPGEFDAAFGSAAKARADALVLMPDALFHSYPARIVELATKQKLPVMYDRTDFVEAGGLMSYGPSLNDLNRQSAWYVDQILRGSKPADLPLVEPIKSQFVVNVKAAEQIGLTVPSTVLNKADKIIK